MFERSQSISMLRFSLLVSLLVSLSLADAQTRPGAPLTDYVGTYADAPNRTLEIVDGDGLFAVVDDAKYPLHPDGADQFKTVTGQKIPFVRDAKGVISGYQQNGKFHPRVSSNISPESAALAHPRPAGQSDPAS